MSAKDKQKDAELDLIIDDIETVIRQPKTPKQSKQKVFTDMNKEQYHKAKALHKAEIAKIKLKRKQEKQDIKRHKMLIKQAKIVYKLTKMKEKLDA